MSDSKKIFTAAGVFKVDARTAGYPDLLKIAQEWAKDENFYELIVRGVSSKNFGIQFVYISKTGEFSESDSHPIKRYYKELQEKYGSGLYAVDYQEGVMDKDDSAINDFVVLKEYKRD